jgi:hypothetical protein
VSTKCHFCAAPATRGVHCDKCGGALFFCESHEDSALGFCHAAHDAFRNKGEKVLVLTTNDQAPQDDAHNIRLLARKS